MKYLCANFQVKWSKNEGGVAILMGEGFMGVYTPFTIFFDFRLRSLRYEKDFLPVLSKLSQPSMVKIFHFSDEWKVVSVAPQRGVSTPP